MRIGLHKGRLISKCRPWIFLQTSSVSVNRIGKDNECLLNEITLFDSWSWISRAMFGIKPSVPPYYESGVSPDTSYEIRSIQFCARSDALALRIPSQGSGRFPFRTESKSYVTDIFFEQAASSSVTASC